MGLNLGTLIGATVIIEQIFALPGIGRELLQAIINRDIPVIEGIVLVFAVVVVIANLIADLLYAVLDPRIRYGGSPDDHRHRSSSPAPPPSRSGVAAPLTGSLAVTIPAGIIAFMVVLCFLGPLILGRARAERRRHPGEPTCRCSRRGTRSAPTRSATTSCSRLLHGGRASLEIAVAVNLLGLLVGGTLGALAAYWGGRVDPIIMRVLDVLIAFPSLVLALAIAQSLGPSKTNTIFALAFFSVAGVRTHRTRGDAAAARADVHDRRAAVGHARVAHRWCGTSRRTSSPGSSRSPCSAWASSSSSRAL